MYRLSPRLILMILLVSGLSAAEGLRLIGDPTALTPEGEVYLGARWSPDGTKIAAGGVNYAGIYIIDFPAGSRTQISDDAGAGYGLSWSPDGNRIAARISTYENFRRRTEIVLLGLDGSRETLMSKRGGIAGVPEWSRQGEYIYLRSSDELHTLKLGASRNDPLQGKLVYLKNFQIYRKDFSADTEKPISAPGQKIVHLRPSPDETQLAFSTTGEHLWLAREDGSEALQLGPGSAPSWSPDGQWIACMRTVDDGHVYLEADILVYRRSGGEAINLTAGSNMLAMYPEWSPDGSRIVFENSRDGRLWVIQVEGR